ncbi:MAG: prenyltransferase/squalene oxidase repeat-containing protein [Planctomycetota bacterium]|jgi:hypothetical protein
MRAKLLLSVAVLAALALSSAGAQDSPPQQEEQKAKEAPKHTEKCPRDCKACAGAIEKGLKYVVSRQHDGGKWACCEVTGSARGFTARHDDVLDTVLCGLALLAEGSTTKEGRFQEALRKAVRFALSNLDPATGRIDAISDISSIPKTKAADFETWYASFMALFLAEVRARDPEAVPAEALKGLGKRLVLLQRESGGWSHDLRPANFKAKVRVRGRRVKAQVHYSEDLAAATNFAVVALAALKRSGAGIPEKALEQAAAYYRKVQNEDGGFQYGRNHAKREDSVKSEPGRTAGALFALLLLNDGKLDAAAGGLKHLRDNMKSLPFSAMHDNEAFSVSFLSGALLCHSLGPEYWGEYVRHFHGGITGGQRSGGSMILSDLERPSAYQTAVALIILQLPLGHLTFLQPSPKKPPAKQEKD